MTFGDTPSATRPVRVLTIDDQAIFRAIARDVIAATKGFEAVGEADGGEAGIEAVGPPLPRPRAARRAHAGTSSGIEVARRLVAMHPEVVVVLISIEERIDVPSAAQLDSIPLVRKQDFGPRLLRRLWSERRR